MTRTHPKHSSMLVTDGLGIESIKSLSAKVVTRVSDHVASIWRLDFDSNAILSTNTVPKNPATC